MSANPKSFSVSDTQFDTRDRDKASLYSLVRDFVNTSFSKWKRFSRDDSFKLALALLKALLIAADACGSAIGEDPQCETVDTPCVLSRRLSAADLQRVVDHNLAGREPHDFQSEVSQSELPVTVLMAACGNGKTGQRPTCGPRNGPTVANCFLPTLRPAPLPRAPEIIC